VDPNESAINAARSLARRHKIENAAFEQCDGAGGWLEHCGREPVDLVISICVFHEAFSRAVQATAATRAGWTIDDTPVWPQSADISVLKSLSAAMSPTGKLVTVNRWGSAEETLQWVRFTEQAGFEIELAASAMLAVKDRVNGEEQLPVTVHRRSDKPIPCLADDILALHTYDKFSSAPAYEGSLAEAHRRSLGASARLAGFEVTYFDGSGIERVELLICGPLAGVYRTTSKGYRALQIGSLAFLPRIAGELNEFAAQREQLGHVEILAGCAAEPRWRLYGFT
jgi:hypothetical protein